MTDSRLTLEIESSDPNGDHVRLTDFLQQLSALRQALRRTEVVAAGQSLIDWQIVALSHNSPATVVLEPLPYASGTPANEPREVIRRFFFYMQTLAVLGDAPEELDRTTLVALKELAAPSRRNRVRTRVHSNGEHIEVLGAVDAVVSAVLAPKTRTHGTIEGRLEFINIHGTRKVFRVYPIVGPERVECVIPDHLVDKAGEAIGRQVRVSGEVTYLNRDPFPNSILVEGIEILPPDSELPTLLDLRGIAPDATGDMSSEEFVRMIRSGE